VDFYAILDISKTASQEDIRNAYRRLAKKYHPDVNNSKDAQAKFVLVKEAYEALIDPLKRIAYDQKATAPLDPYTTYKQRMQEQQAREAAEAQKKYEEFIKQKKKIRESKMYYPYMALLYISTFFFVGISVFILLACVYAIVWYHVFMFFFVLPFICVAVFVLKITLDEFKKYKGLFS
jgi:hypothetical protein